MRYTAADIVGTHDSVSGVVKASVVHLKVLFCSQTWVQCTQLFIHHVECSRSGRCSTDNYQPTVTLSYPEIPSKHLCVYPQIMKSLKTYTLKISYHVTLHEIQMKSVILSDARIPCNVNMKARWEKPSEEQLKRKKFSCACASADWWV